MDLAACQDTIRDEAQTCQQYQNQLKVFQISDGSRAHRASDGLWGMRAEDTAESRVDGRSLRQPTTAGDARDGGRPFRDDDPGSGRPVGFAVGTTALETFRHRLGREEVRQPRMHNSQAEREPYVQARDCSSFDLESGFRRPTEQEPPAGTSIPSPPAREHEYRMSSERPRHKE